MKTQKLSNHLESIAKAYAERQDALDFYAYTDRAYKYCRITFKEIKTEFVYSLSGSANYPISTLSCRVYLSHQSPYFFEIQELIDYLDIYDYHCYSFPFIENEKRLEACFKYITDFLEFRNDEILSLCENEDELKENKLEEIKRVFGYDSANAPHDKAGKDAFYSSIFKHYSDFLIPRYTSGKAYIEFVKNNYTKSLDEYNKIEEKTGYETKLIEFINEQYAPYQAVPDECASITDIRKYTESNVKMFLLTTVISIVAFCILFMVIQAVINLICLAATDFAICRNPLVSSVCGILPGAVFAVVFRKRIEPILYGNKKKAYEFYDLIEKPDKTKFGTIWAISAAVVSFVFLLCICRPTVAIKNNVVKVDRNPSLFVRYDKYDISDFVRVICIDESFDGFNKTGKDVDPYYALITKTNNYIYTNKLKLSEKDTEAFIKYIFPNTNLEYVDRVWGGIDEDI